MIDRILSLEEQVTTLRAEVARWRNIAEGKHLQGSNGIIEQCVVLTEQVAMLKKKTAGLKEQLRKALSRPCPHCQSKENCRGWAGAIADIADAAMRCDCNTCDTCLDRYREE